MSPARRSTKSTNANVDAGVNAVGYSLLRQVFLRMTLTMLAAIVLVIAVLFFEFQAHVDSLRDRSLGGQAADIARHLQVDTDGKVSVDLPVALAAAYRAESGRIRFAVVNRSAQVLASSFGVTDALDSQNLVFEGAPLFFATINAHSGRSFYGASIAHENSFSRLSIQVQQSAEHEDVVLDTFLDELGEEVAWIVVLVFGAILLVTYWTLRASLSSLTELSRQAAMIGPETLGQRLRVDTVPMEVRPMVVAVNAALDRVAAAFRQQRRFTADAAHEMRTPIAILRAHLGTVDDKHAHALGRDLLALDRVVGQLLKLAQVDSMSVSLHEGLDLHEVAVQVAILMGPAAIARDRGIAVIGDEHVLVRGDANTLEVALRNLVENALNHTPVGSEVEISVSAQQRSFSVLDRGPGVAADDRDRIFERFWRHQRNTMDGAGLGLSIVSRIVAAHGASIQVSERAAGGAVFTIAFAAQCSST